MTHSVQRARWSTTAVLALAVAAIACGPAPAADDEAGLPGGSVTLWTDSTELFMEYPALFAGDSERFAIHITDLTDFSPLTTGRVTLRFLPRGGGEPVVVVEEGPRAPGIFGASPRFTRPGVYDLVMLVDSPQARDSLLVPGLTVHASPADVPAATGGDQGGIAFLKEQQWNTPGFATVAAVAGAAAESFEASGRILPAAGGYADVQAPVPGLIDVAGVEAAPVPGSPVRRGQVLAVLTAATAGGTNAHAEARARLREAEDEHARAQRLVAAGAVPQRRLHEAGIRLDAARETIWGLGDGAAGGRYEIRAPIDGVIGERNVPPGARVEAGATLFTIVDPVVVWLQSWVPAERVPAIAAGAGAEFDVEGLDRVFRTDRLVSIGTAVDPVRRMVPVLHAVRSAGSLRFGMTATVRLPTGARREGILIPASAVVDDDGRPVVYVQVEGERFEPRRITIGGREGSRVLVRDGIVVGERVVSGAAFQVRLASLSTAVPAHGHEH